MNCPKCKSEDLHHMYGSGGVNSQCSWDETTYFCNSCGVKIEIKTSTLLKPKAMIK